MPFIPHTQEDLRVMLETIGVADVEQLFEEIPAGLAVDIGERLPPGLNEMQVARLFRERASRDDGLLCFAGAGAYDHHIPAAVWDIATRGEFYTAYTPYQAEASQGTLQALYEFQSMMAGLLGLDAANASLYDGASALGEAVLMAVRSSRGRQRVLLPRTVHPAYRRVVATLVRHLGVELVELPFDPAGGHIDPATLDAFAGSEPAALVIPQPNYFGVLEEVDALTDWIQGQGGLAIGCVNPLAMGLLKPPGAWGTKGADIACGEGQPLGAPLSSGGPYFGFIACRQPLLRQMPGRIAGRTVDANGKEGFVLTLQAREQHIRRARATSNICTNQGLLTVAAAIHMALLGPHGVRETAIACHANLNTLLGNLSLVEGVGPVFNRPCFHEAVLSLPQSAGDILGWLAQHGIVGGVALGGDYPELGPNALLVCATETKEVGDMAFFADALSRALEELK